GVAARNFVTAARDLSVLPIAIFIGYRILYAPQAAKPLTYIWLVCSIASAVIILFLVRETATEHIVEGRGFDRLRLISGGGDVGLSAGALLLMAIVSRRRIIPLAA